MATLHKDTRSRDPQGLVTSIVAHVADDPARAAIVALLDMNSPSRPTLATKRLSVQVAAGGPDLLRDSRKEYAPKLVPVQLCVGDHSVRAEVGLVRQQELAIWPPNTRRICICSSARFSRSRRCFRITPCWDGATLIEINLLRFGKLQAHAKMDALDWDLRNLATQVAVLATRGEQCLRTPHLSLAEHLRDAPRARPCQRDHKYPWPMPADSFA